MRIHFAVATAVLVLAFSYGVTKLELMALLVAISFVLIAEMVNTAIEATIDLADDLVRPAREDGQGHRRRRRPDRQRERRRDRLPRLRRPAVAPSSRLVERLREAPSNLTLIALILVILIVIASKALTGRGTPLSGGLPSGHAALAFGGFTAITFIVDEQRVVVSFVALIMALLVAQTQGRVGHPHDERGRPRRRDRYARDHDPLPGARVTDQELLARPRPRRRTPTRRTRTSTSARPRSCATGA